MQHYHLSLRAWAAFSPFRSAPEEWIAWSSDEVSTGVEADAKKPDLSFIPARLRRRLGALGKAAIWCAGQVEPEGDVAADSVIFCSQHGEVSRTISLLQDLASEEPLSPTGFSHSVHNAAAGIYSIARHSRRPVTALSAGPDSIFTAIIEAYVQLRELLALGVSDPRVLCVMYDDPVPAELLEKPVAGGDVQAMALMLGLPAEDCFNHFSIGLLPPTENVMPEASTDQFLKFVLGSSPQHTLLRSDTRQWSLRRAG